MQTDAMKNLSLGRNTEATVYDFIVQDLKEAQLLLSETFLDGQLQQAMTERLRPTKWAASALLARTYLYKGDYTNAEIEASAIMDNTQLFGLTSLNETFLANSKEAIWQLQPVVAGHNTEDAWTFVLPVSGPSDIMFGQGNPVYLSDALLSKFENGDNRRVKWMDSVIVDNVKYIFPYKYKNATFGELVTEYLMVLRLAEQYLIRAECRARRGDYSGARQDINSIRLRAGLSEIFIEDESMLLAAVLNERQVELFTEWGHRWFDLKRLNMLDSVMSVETEKKGGAWAGFRSVHPIPFSDIQRSKLIQNNGY
jgi:starch-binding outer membrane protein, SusD/RagB family